MKSYREAMYETWKSELSCRKSNRVVAKNYSKKRMPLYHETNYVNIKMLERLISLYENGELYKEVQPYDVYWDIIHKWTKIQRIAAALASDGQTENVTELKDDELNEAKKIAKEKIDRILGG